MMTEPISVIELLRGGDLRSLGHTEKLVATAGNDRGIFKELINAVLHKDPVISLRATDAVEKTAKVYPYMLEEYREELLTLLKEATTKHVRWHLAMMVNYISWNKRETVFILNTLLNWFYTDTSKIVKVNCLETLCSIALKNIDFREEIKALVEESLIKGAPSLKARARKLIKKFDL